MATKRDWSNGDIDLPGASDIALSGRVAGGATAWSVTADGAFVVKTVTAGTASAFTQTYSTADATVPTATAAAVATTSATNSSPYGYAQAQADAIVTNVNALVADSLQNRKLLNKIIDVLQAAGLAT